MKEYIEKKIKKLQEDCNPETHLITLAAGNAEINKKWKRERNQDDKCWQSVTTNDDVLDLINRFDGQVRFFEESVPLGRYYLEDSYHMMLAEYRVIQGLRKMARFMNTSPSDYAKFTALSVEEIDELFNRLDNIVNRMKEQRTRNFMWD